MLTSLLAEQLIRLEIIIYKFLMNRNMNPPCKSHVVHCNLSELVPEDVTSPFKETDSSVRDAVSAPLNPPLYPNLHFEIVVEEEAVKKIVRECSQARGTSSDEEEVIDVVRGVPIRVRSGAV